MSSPDGIRLKPSNYSDREPWACLRAYRDSDYDLHWESRRRSAASGVPNGDDRRTNTRLAHGLVNPARSDVDRSSSPRLSLKRRGSIEYLGLQSHGSTQRDSQPLVYSLPLPPTGPTGVMTIKTQAVQVGEVNPKESEETRVGMVVGRAEGLGVAADTVSAAGTASAEGPFAGGLGGPTALAEVTPAGSSIATSNTAASVPDERAVWVRQRLCIRSTQNLVHVDLKADATPCVSDEGGDCGAANVPGAGSPQLTQPSHNEGNKATVCPRHRTRSVRDASSSATTTTVARHGPRGRNAHKTAPASRRTSRKVRVKAFDIRVEEYKEERRHVSHDGL